MFTTTGAGEDWASAGVIPGITIPTGAGVIHIVTMEAIMAGTAGPGDGIHTIGAIPVTGEAITATLITAIPIMAILITIMVAATTGTVNMPIAAQEGVFMTMPWPLTACADDLT